MKIGYYAPPPGAHTGVADYATVLESALGAFATVRRDGGPADAHLYHLGNNPLHKEIYRRALEAPGVIVLHDAVLHHFMLGALSEAEYSDEFVFNYGEWRRDIARDLWRDRAKAGIDPRYFRYPMLRRIVERSLAVIVHNPGAAALVRATSNAAAGRPVFVIPHLYAPAADSGSRGTEFRDRIGVHASTTLFGIFGYLREPKRIAVSIAAFRRLHAIRPDTALLLAGEVVSKDLARALETDAAHPAIHRFEHLDARDFRDAIAAVDCCINLRYPAAGETSGILIQAMGAARPTIVTDNLENSEFPAAACLKVAHGPGEATGLFDSMSLICDFPCIAHDIGAVARRHVLTDHAPDRVAKMYVEALRVASGAA